MVLIRKRILGGAGPLTELHRESLAGPRPPICLLLHFAAVTGIDFPAMIALARLLRSDGEAGTRVVPSASPEQPASRLERNPPAAVFTDLMLEPNLERSLEHCEEIAIAAWKTASSTGNNRLASLLEQAADDLERLLEQRIGYEDLTEGLHDQVTPCDDAAGQAPASADSHNEVLQLPTAGRASARDRTGERLLQLVPGDIVSTDAMSGTRVVSVIADEACRTKILHSSIRQALEEQEIVLAFRLHRNPVTRRIVSGAGRSREIVLQLCNGRRGKSSRVRIACSVRCHCSDRFCTGGRGFQACWQAPGIHGTGGGATVGRFTGSSTITAQRPGRSLANAGLGSIPRICLQFSFKRVVPLFLHSHGHAGQRLHWHEFRNSAIWFLLTGQRRGLPP